MLPSMRSLLQPASVAIIGATPGAGRGGWIHEQLLRHGYTGPIYPVNPKYTEIRGVQAYPSLLDIPAPVDFVAVALGADHALRVIQECAQKQVQAALFVASGFAEVGPIGQQIQNELRRIALAHGIAVCGPNCYGIANLHGQFAAYGGSLTQPLRRGAIALLFQSGALTHATMDPVAARTSGYSYIITTGNEAVVELADYIEAIADDPNTRVIACFVEGFQSPQRFFGAARKAISQGKRMVVLKTGRSQLAQRAALAHTGAITGPDAVYDAIFRQLGIARVYDLDELIETAELLSIAPHAQPGDTAIVSISGGSCGVASDLADTLGLKLAPLSEPTISQLRAILPPFATAQNPLDITGAIGENPALLPGALTVLAGDPQINSIALALNTPYGGDEAGQALYQQMCRVVADCASKSDIPHILFSMSSGGYDPAILQIAQDAKLPLLMGMRESLAALAHWQRIPVPQAPYDIQEVPTTITLPYSPEETPLGERDAKQILSGIGIPVCREIAAATREDAIQAAEQIGYPVVLKIDSPDILHKTEASGIRLNLQSREQVAVAYDQIMEQSSAYRPTAKLRGVLVQEQVQGGIELLVGMTNQAGLGPLVVCGLGGVLVELLDDTALRMAPFGLQEAYAMIAETRAASLLAGWRGGPALDLEALATALAQLSRFAWQYRDRIHAIDINPLIVLPRGQGVRVVDALIIVMGG